jgi:hypothetical protein
VYPATPNGDVLAIITILVRAGEDIYKAIRDAQQNDRDRVVKAVSAVLDANKWRPWATLTASAQATTPAASTPTANAAAPQ